MLDRRRRGLSCAPTERRGYDYLTNLRGRSSSTCELLWSTCSPIIDLLETRWYTQDPGSGEAITCKAVRRSTRAKWAPCSCSWQFSGLRPQSARLPRVRLAIVLIHMVQVFLFGALQIPERARLGLGILLRLLTLGTAFTGQLLQFDQLDLNTPQTSGMTTPPQLCMRELKQASCGPAIVA
jgi:hypothetical protein